MKISDIFDKRVISEEDRKDYLGAVGAVNIDQLSQKQLILI